MYGEGRKTSFNDANGEGRKTSLKDAIGVIGIGAERKSFKDANGRGGNVLSISEGGGKISQTTI